MDSRQLSDKNNINDRSTKYTEPKCLVDVLTGVSEISGQRGFLQRIFFAIII